MVGKKSCFQDGFELKWCVLELPRGSLARYCMARIQNCSPRVRNYVGFDIIA